MLYILDGHIATQLETIFLLLLGGAIGGNSGQLDTGKYYLCKFRVTSLKTKLSVFALYSGYKDMEVNQLPP